jgi:putative peptidoglycan lipid II flippase
LAGRFGLKGLAWGVPLGAFLQLVIQFPTVKMLGYRWKFVFDTKSEEVRTMVRLMVPRILTIILSQVNLLIITVLASTLMAGSLTVFNLANNLQSFPLGIFAISYAVACFPTLSALGGPEKRREFTAVLLTTARQILFFIIPLSIFLIVFRAQAVRVILGHGHFGWQETILTIGTLEIFCFSLFAQSLSPLFSRAFWALHDSRTPFFVSLFTTLLNIALALIFAPRYGLYGLVGSFTVASILNALLLFFLLRKEGLAPIPREFYATLYKISASALAAAAAGRFMLYGIEPLLDTHTFTGILTQGALGGIVAGFLYLYFCAKLGISEFVQFKEAFQKKLQRTEVKTTEIMPEE